jgi:hypothetical protein
MTDQERVKAILEYHKEKNKGVKIVKVTTTRYYEIPTYTSQDSDELLKEWFERFNTTSTHAFRDGSLLIQHFNGDAKVLDENLQ